MDKDFEYFRGSTFAPGFLAEREEILRRFDEAASLEDERRAADAARLGGDYRSRFEEDGWYEGRAQQLRELWDAFVIEDEPTMTHEQKMAEIAAILRGGA
jgi:hypothetical protein